MLLAVWPTGRYEQEYQDTQGIFLTIPWPMFNLYSTIVKILDVEPRNRCQVPARDSRKVHKLKPKKPCKKSNSISFFDFRYWSSRCGCLPGVVSAQDTYMMPPAEVAALVDAPSAPSLRIAPDNSYMLLLTLARGGLHRRPRPARAPTGRLSD